MKPLIKLKDIKHLFQSARITLYYKNSWINDYTTKELMKFTNYDDDYIKYINIDVGDSCIDSTLEIYLK